MQTSVIKDWVNAIKDGLGSKNVSIVKLKE